ncbi:hypothetical protein CVT25_012825 [Psilocybe cyanescens]|uniref:Uncharacterized protein n=1 Tax=Psilocybe cyanescens TaxID=93625 RepID=A0A409XFA8_PSICY|nr:hypothetical protein CVT25_012825 [Psilocybe cyanescens]
MTVRVQGLLHLEISCAFSEAHSIYASNFSKGINSHKNCRERRVAKKSAEDIPGAGAEPVASGSSTSRTIQSTEKGTPKNTVNGAAKTATFEEGDDFIAFSDLSDDDEPGPSSSKQDRNDKGKEAGRSGEQEDVDADANADTRTSSKSKNKAESTMSDRARNKSRMREPLSRASAPE